MFPVALAQFIGLITQPSHAVVDTAAEEGCIGTAALKRLESALFEKGLRVRWVWITSEVPCTAIGGQATFVGQCDVPLGLGKMNGVARLNVIKDDDTPGTEIPFLLPMNLQECLNTVINIPGAKLEIDHFGANGLERRSLDTTRLPSGHRTVEVLDFDPCGWKLPEGAYKMSIGTGDPFKIMPESSTSKAPPEARAAFWQHFSEPPPCVDSAGHARDEAAQSSAQYKERYSHGHDLFSTWEPFDQPLSRLFVLSCSKTNSCEPLSSCLVPAGTTACISHQSSCTLPARACEPACRDQACQAHVCDKVSVSGPACVRTRSSTHDAHEVNRVKLSSMSCTGSLPHKVFQAV